MTIGFNNNDSNEESIYDTFVGKPGHYGCGAVSATGVLKEINMREGYLMIQPSLVGYGDSGIRLETESPTVIGITPGNPISMRPLKENDLEKTLEEREKAIEAKAKK